MSLARTVAQQNAFVIVPKVTAFLSLIGSSIILWDVVAVYRGKRRERLSPRHRLLAGMSVCDLLASSGFFLGTWSIPSDFPWSKWNVGTQATCTLQGVLVQFSIGTCCYNGCLAVYYYLVIRHGWSNERLGQFTEPVMHLLSLGFPFGAVITGIALDLYNPVGWGCSIAESPLGCNQSYKKEDGGYPCVRGDNAYLYTYVFFYIPVWITFIILSTCLVLIYMKIRRLEESMLGYRPSHSHAKAFAFQAIMYAGAFFITWAPASSAFLLHVLVEKAFFWHLFLAVVLVPSQGFFNMIVYKLPEYQRFFRKRRRESTSRHACQGSDNRSNSNSNSSRFLIYRPFRNIFRSMNNSSESSSPKDNNALGNVEEQNQEDETANECGSAEQFKQVNNEVSVHVREELPASSLQGVQQQDNEHEMSLSSDATIEC
jgi:hypothetical protein